MDHDRNPTRSGAASLPSMTTLLDAAGLDPRFSPFPRTSIKDALVQAVEAARDLLVRTVSDAAAASIDALLDSAADQLRDESLRRLDRVINATGIVLHTGLGRAPLAAAVVESLRSAAGYCNLEFELDTGQRGQRGRHTEAMLCRLTGAEAALIVNNNAAATMLVLAGLAAGREVIVSRGQLIEIGGSFRLPDVMACSGCQMREVGTTNKTRLSDYERAISDRTALLLHVHPSNYRVVGFAESPGTSELVGLARKHGLAVYDDLGSGAFLDDDLWRQASEPTVPDSLAAGADILSFSGDKLLGGPQAGLILGHSELIERLRRHPMARALRIDKLTIAALQGTLELYLDPPRAMREIPTLRMLHQPLDELRARAERLRNQLATALPSEQFAVAEAEAFAGGGSLPAWPLPTAVVRWTLQPGASVDDLARRLRTGDPPVVTRIDEGRIVFDTRTVDDRELDAIARAARAAIG